MEQKFKQFIEEKQLCTANSKLLLAVSGGLDSMCMAHLFYQLGFQISIAHVNHGLRAAESDAEELFVKEWAASRNISFYSQKVNVKEKMELDGSSLQEAARELRYAFLQELALKINCDLIATAHHLDDAIETILFHLFRGTGPKGLRGIPVIRENIIRPLLFAYRSELLAFAQAEHIPWMEDSSNAKEDYTRNQIRLNLLPEIEAVFPEFKQGIIGTASRLERVLNKLEEVYKKDWDSIVEIVDNKLAINSEKLLNLSFPDLVLSEYLVNYGFKADRANAVIELAQNQSGKKLISDSHILLRDRTWIFILPVAPEEEQSWYINSDLDVSGLPRQLKFEAIKEEGEELVFSDHIAWMEQAQLVFPLELRTWRAGDKFQPLGMKGKMKLSDFLTQQKLPVHQKKKVLVLCSAGRIVWVAGFRISEKMRLTPQSQQLVRFSIDPTYYTV